MSSLDLAPISLLRLNVKIFLDSILIIHKVIHMLNLLKVRYTVSVIIPQSLYYAIYFA